MIKKKKDRKSQELLARPDMADNYRRIYVAA